LKPLPKRIAKLNGYISGNIIHVYGVRGIDGFDMANGHLILDNGRRAQLSSRLAVIVGNALQSVIDDPATQLDARVHPCPWDTRYYECPAMIRTPGEGESEHQARTTSVVFRAARPTPLSIPGTSPRTARKAAPVVVGPRGIASSWSMDCQNASLAIYAATANWRNARTHLDAMAFELNKELMLDAANDLWDLVYGGEVVPEPVLAGAVALRLLEFEVAATSLMLFHTQLNILATQYSGFGCWNPGSGNWPLSTSGAATDRTSVGSGMGWGCKFEHWSVSLDGGVTWHDSWPYVCEWVWVV
jgi:hypothetical protein